VQTNKRKCGCYAFQVDVMLSKWMKLICPSCFLNVRCEAGLELFTGMDGVFMDGLRICKNLWSAYEDIFI